MPQDNIFKIDPIRTDLTAPVTNVTVQQPLDTSKNDQRLSLGLSSLSDSFTRLARTRQADQIHNDTITAELAAAYEQEMPGGLEPEAQLAYSRAVDRTTKGKIIQQMQDFLLIEGSDILSDNRVDRKTRATSFKNQLLGILQGGKASISKVNAAEMFADMDTMFGQIMGKANVFLAKDKKQEAMATASSSFRQLFKEHLAFMEELIPKVSDTDELGNELSASQYAQKLSKFHSGWTAKHINSKWFNKAVTEISRTNVGADIQDIKATALTIVGDELLKKIAKNPELVNEGLMRDIISNVKGSTKGVTLQDEIDSQSEFGKVLEGVYKDYNSGLKSTLKSLEKTRTDNDKARNIRIADHIQDGLITGKYKTKEEALNLAISITDDAKQRAVTKHINAHFSGENKKDIGHADFGPLVKFGADNFYDAATDTFDSVGFYAYAGEQGFKTTAIEKAAAQANPQTRRGERRKEFFAQEPIKQLTQSFDNILKSTLKEYDLLSKYNALAAKFGDKKVDLNNPLVRKKLGITGEVGLKIRRVLDAQIALGAALESLIRNNPDVPVHQLVAEAQKQAQGLIQDAITDKPFGTAVAVAESGKEKVKPLAEKLVEGFMMYHQDLTEIPQVNFINSKKGLFSTNKEAKEDYGKKATDELKAYDKAKAKLVKIQKEYKSASPAQKARIVASFGANPENLKVSTAIPEIAEIVNPDPAVRRHLAARKLAGQTEIQQPMKLDQPSAWDTFTDFLQGLRTKVIKPAAKEVSQSLQQFVGRRRGDKPTDIIDLKKERQLVDVSPKPTPLKKTEELKTNEISPKLPDDTDVVPRISDADIAPFAPSLETNEPAIDKNSLTKTAINILKTAQSLFVSEASGEEVVSEAIKVINKIGFPDDKGFLKEIAKHESHSGKHQDTFRKNYHGGIYQIDKIGFTKTQDIKSHPKLKKWYKKIKDISGVDWTKVKWEDLRKPFYSTLAARLYLITIPAVIPKTLKERAKYYKKYYNRSGKGTPSKFMESQK